MHFAVATAFVLAQLSAPSNPASLPTASPMPATTSSPVSALDANDAIISNSGSTNAVGYTIALATDGSAVIRRGETVRDGLVALPQTRWLFLRLAAAGPLDALSTGHCMKSMSFGTTTTIAWHGATSGDLSCRPTPAGIEISRTIGIIVDRLGLGFEPRRRMVPVLRANPPGI